MRIFIMSTNKHFAPTLVIAVQAWGGGPGGVREGVCYSGSAEPQTNDALFERWAWLPWLQHHYFWHAQRRNAAKEVKKVSKSVSKYFIYWR